jgi:ABC-type polysaccharide/polyol phosphate transport system ATPase subunit
MIKATDFGIYFHLRSSSQQKLKGMLTASKKADKFWALSDLNFELPKGEILGVVGNNGAGKSTLLRAIAGVYLPDRGSLEVEGTISPLLSLGTGFKLELSGIENIYLNAAIMGFTRIEVEAAFEDIVSFSELGNFIYQPVKNYSSGMRARLGFSIASFLKRDVMLVDEVLGVGDFKFREKSQNKLSQLIHEDRTIVIVSHDLKSIEKYATMGLWLENGKQKMFGKSAEVVAAYLKAK